MHSAEAPGAMRGEERPEMEVWSIGITTLLNPMGGYVLPRSRGSAHGGRNQRRDPGIRSNEGVTRKWPLQWSRVPGHPRKLLCDVFCLLVSLGNHPHNGPSKKTEIQRIRAASSQEDNRGAPGALADRLGLDWPSSDAAGPGCFHPLLEGCKALHSARASVAWREIKKQTRMPALIACDEGLPVA